jgi:CelD/BcsL family acetyltransferase involved in cellulose biosynthesis
MGSKSLLKVCALGFVATLAATPAVATSSEVAARAATFQRTASTGLYQGFDWFANKNVPQPDRVVPVKYDTRDSGILWGAGTWACSPAGFGQMSTCTGR